MRGLRRFQFDPRRLGRGRSASRRRLRIETRLNRWTTKTVTDPGRPPTVMTPMPPFIPARPRGLGMARTTTAMAWNSATQTLTGTGTAAHGPWRAPTSPAPIPARPEAATTATTLLTGCFPARRRLRETVWTMSVTAWSSATPTPMATGTGVPLLSAVSDSRSSLAAGSTPLGQACRGGLPRGRAWQRPIQLG